MPAKAGIQGRRFRRLPWILAFAGMTDLRCDASIRRQSLAPVEGLEGAALAEDRLPLAARFGGVDEMKAAGLSPLPSRLVRPPRVAESLVHLECRLWRVIDLPSWDPEEPNGLIIGEVVGIHISDHLIKNGRVDIVSARPIARLGYSEYAVVGDKFNKRRPG